MAEQADRILPGLPVFPRTENPVWPGLRVSGLVEKPTAFSLGDLKALPQTTVVADFRCEEGWVVPRQTWEGPRVAEVLRRVRVLPEARWIEAGAGDFTIALSVEEALQGDALLALRLNGEPLPPEHGGPCRLVVPGKACYTSVKWVDRLWLVADRPNEIGKAIALFRIGRETL
ncbi:Protein-methionine-sulfoxide reductase catalytic subunit MsrP [bacterium HR23]|nr:Protein-methionine-sulfoxide reductase catalytic subunit MsrP [bacterium HR23]